MTDLSGWSSLKTVVMFMQVTQSCIIPRPRPPVDGGWSEWKEGTCTVTCGGGTQTDTRECNNPKPENGGRLCIGDKTKTVECNTDTCPGFGSCSGKNGHTKCGGCVAGFHQGPDEENPKKCYSDMLFARYGWNYARKSCDDKKKITYHKTYLTSISTETVQKYIENDITTRPFNPLCLGGIRPQDHTQFFWLDSRMPVNTGYENWAPGEPTTNPTSNCMIMDGTSPRTWKNIDCTRSGCFFVCSYEPVQCQDGFVPGPGLDAGSNPRCYHFLKPNSVNSWTVQRTQCIKMGFSINRRTDLTSVFTEEAQSFIIQNTNKEMDVCIGGRIPIGETPQKDRFIWIQTQQFVSTGYTNWADSEPTLQWTKDCMIMEKSESFKWSNIDCLAALTCTGVCSYDP